MKGLRSAICAALTLSGLLGAAPAAQAAVTSSVGGAPVTLTVTSDAGDGISITCAANAVKVNGSDPGSGPAPCSRVQRFTITGGPAGNSINLTGVTVAAGFTAPELATALDNTVDGAAGSDSLNGSTFRQTLTGGTGNDTLRGNTGPDTLSGGPEDDDMDGRGGLFDRVTEKADVNFTLTNSALTGLGTDRLAGFEEALLTGGASPNRIDASGFVGRQPTPESPMPSTLLRGDRFEDTLIAPDTSPADLSGQDGDDTLIGGGAEDILRGQDETDSLDGGGANDTVVESTDGHYTLTNTSLASSITETDSLTNVERAHLTTGPSENRLDASAFTLGRVTLQGGEGKDTIKGGQSAADDLLKGGAGNDRLTGGAGPDFIVGDEGVDTVDYSDKGRSPVTVDLDGSFDDGTTNEGDNANPTIENIVGANGGDSLTGNGLANRLEGGNGDDQLFGLTGDDVFPSSAAADGADRMEGGGDNDTADYSLRTINSPLTVDLDGVADDGGSAGGEGDNAGADIENLIGGAGSDTLTGNSAPNRLTGRQGNDIVSGLYGPDTIFVEDGLRDEVFCGPDRDVANVDPIDQAASNCETLG